MTDQLKAKAIYKRVMLDRSRRDIGSTARLIQEAKLPMTLVFDFQGGTFATKTLSSIQLSKQNFKLEEKITSGEFLN